MRLLVIGGSDAGTEAARRAREVTPTSRSPCALMVAIAARIGVVSRTVIE
jgi:hypothetical protein